MNLQQNLELCTPVSIQCSPINQVKNDYIIPVTTADHMIRAGIRALNTRLGKKTGAFKLLYELANFRNAKKGARVFPSKKTLAKRLGLTERTVQRYIRLFEAMGILIVEDCLIAGHYTSCRFHFSKLLLDLGNESLQQEIASLPTRKSRANGCIRHGKVLAYIEPRDISPKGGGDSRDSLSLQESYPRQESLNTSPNTTRQEAAENEVVGELALKKVEAKRVLSAYNRRFPVAGQRSREEFVETYIQGSYNAQKLIGYVEEAHSCPLIKPTTLSPMRLFQMEDRVIPLRNMILKKIRGGFKDSYDRQMTIDRLMRDEKIFSWFYTGRNADRVSALMEKTLVSIWTERL